MTIGSPVTTDEDVQEIAQQAITDTPQFMDQDGDTGIRVESVTGADEDIIELVVNGVVVGTMATNSLNIGGATPDPMFNFQTLDNTGADWQNWQIGTLGSAFQILKKSLGTKASPLPLPANTKIGGIGWEADDGVAGSFVSAEIAAYAVGDQNDTNGGSQIIISTTPQGSKTREDQVIINDSGNIQLTKYPHAREDGPTSKALFVNQDGNLRYGTVSAKKTIRHMMQGRMYCYTDLRWISAFDDNYGIGYYQWQENAGTSANPVFEWEHMGVPVSAGEKLGKFLMQSRTNSTEVQDIEVYVVFRTPNTVGALDGVGVDNDSEMSNTEIFRELFNDPDDANKWGGDFSGNINDIHRRTVDLDFVCPEDGWVGIYLKPQGSLSSNRYSMTSMSLDIEI